MDNYQKENSYSNILKRLSAFGGAQLFNILMAALRGKFVAIFLGPEGMGISSLFNSALNTIQSFTTLGLNLAVVKEVAAAKERPAKFGHIIAVALRLVIFTSLLGAAVCSFGAPLWSKLSFGNYNYTFAFILLGISVAFSSAGAAFFAILQGLGAIKIIAKSSMVGGLTGIFISVPLFWQFGIKGIVPSIIIANFSVFLFNFISYCKTRPSDMEKVAFSWSRHKPLVLKLISIGLILMIGYVASTWVAYIINMIIRHFGTVSDVGLFQAANTLTSQSIGAMFSAISVEYFPRLSAIAFDNRRMTEVVGRQTEIMTLITTPVALMLIMFTPLVIHIMLTAQYLVVVPLIRWMSLGMLVQSICFPLGYLYVARDDRKAYIWMEVISANIIWIVAALVCYILWGLVGLGMSVVARGLLELTINFILCHRRYGFRYTGKLWRKIAFSLALGLTGFCLTTYGGENGWMLTIPVLLVSLGYSFINMRNRVLNL